MRNLYDHHFSLKPGTLVYIPTTEGRARGVKVKEKIEGVWMPPQNYFHLQKGGHVEAARQHRDAPWLASLDIQRFFDQITRAKVHRVLKTIGFSRTDAWEMACDSVVDKKAPSRKFSIPFGFVQSPMIASVVLAHSALGVAIRRLVSQGRTLTVYVDDITVSGPSQDIVRQAVVELEAAANLAGFAFNRDKTQPPGAQVTSFNMVFGSGQMDVVGDRMAEFEVKIRSGNEYVIDGVLGYVGSVNRAQGDNLASKLA